MLKSILFESLSGADVPLRECGCFAVGILGADVTVKDGLCTVSGVNQGTSGNRGGRTFCSLACVHAWMHTQVKKDRAHFMKEKC